MKRIYLFILALSIAFTTKAQLTIPASYGPSFAISAEFNEVIGPENYYYRVGPGINAKVELTVARGFNFTASAGFLAFFTGSTYAYYLTHNDMPNRTYNFIPLKVGGRYYFGESWYTELQGGTVLYTRDYRNPALTVAGGGGVSIPIDGKHAFDIGARFENWSRKEMPYQVNLKHMVSIRLAYKIGI
jgi:hypothetical protein